MTRKLTILLTALTLAFTGAGLTACSSDDRPEAEDVERSAEDAAEGSKDAVNDAAREAEQATDDE
jgi:hypothetical protein